MRVETIAAAILFACSAAACGRGGDENLVGASGNSLTQAQIDAALGPANQQEMEAGNAAAQANAVEANNGVAENEAVENEGNEQ